MIGKQEEIRQIDKEKKKRCADKVEQEDKRKEKQKKKQKDK